MRNTIAIDVLAIRHCVPLKRGIGLAHDILSEIIYAVKEVVQFTVWKLNRSIGSVDFFHVGCVPGCNANQALVD